MWCFEFSSRFSKGEEARERRGQEWRREWKCEQLRKSPHLGHTKGGFSSCWTTWRKWGWRLRAREELFFEVLGLEASFVWRRKLVRKWVPFPWRVLRLQSSRWCWRNRWRESLRRAQARRGSRGKAWRSWLWSTEGDQWWLLDQRSSLWLWFLVKPEMQKKKAIRTCLEYTKRFDVYICEWVMGLFVFAYLGESWPSVEFLILINILIMSFVGFHEVCFEWRRRRGIEVAHSFCQFWIKENDMREGGGA